MRLVHAAAVLATVVCISCTRNPQPPPTSGHMLLVPDWKNHVVHRIGLDGSYEGDFLDPARSENPSLDRVLWNRPLSLLMVSDAPPTFWLAADRALSAWGPRGDYLRTIIADTTVLEVPTCMVAIGDKVYVASADTRDMQIFSRDGNRIGAFGHPELYRANDCEVGPDGSIYVASTLRNAGASGIVSVWSPKDISESAKPIAYRVPGDLGEDGTHWAHGLAFDANGKLLITEFARGRVERWDLERNERVDVLLDSDEAGAYLKLERGPDGLVYMAGPAGLYRFDSRATPADLKDLKPFFDARQLVGRYPEPFSPTGIIIAPRSAPATPR